MKISVSLRVAQRELRGGLKDFWLFLACLIIGTSVIAAVGSLSQSVSQSIFSEAKTLLGGDVSLSTTNKPISVDERNYLESWGQVTETFEMRAMATKGADVALVELKGVAENYPLLGALTDKNGPVRDIQPGTVLVAEDLLGRLSASIGDTITIGPTAFRIAGVIAQEPDRISGAFGLGPRVIARSDDLKAAGLTGPEELLKYHDHVLLHDEKALPAFQNSLKEKFPNAGWALRTFHDANQGTSRFVTRLQLFLTLAGLTTLLIGGVGILNATQAYMLRKINSVAVMKALGASETVVFTSYALLLGIISLLGVFAGAALGGVAAVVILPMLASFFPVTGGGIFHPTALLEAMVFGLLTVAVFVISVLGKSVVVRPALLFRAAGVNANGPLPLKWVLLNAGLLFLLVASLILTSTDKKIASGFILAALISVGLLVGVTRIIQAATRRYTFKKPWARLAAGNIHKPGAATLSVVLSIGISLTVLIALLLVEGNFRREVNDTIPEVAPSLFFIDIQPEQRDAFSALLSSQKIVSDVALKPMIRGRITSLNGTPVEKATVKDEAKWALESDRGLSYASEEPDGSPVVEGDWWSKDYKGPPLISFDQKLAEGMGLKIGDRIGLNILGQPIEGSIANLRDVNYLTLQINFSMILSPGLIEQFPATFLATAHVDGGAPAELAIIRLVTEKFPNISSVSVRDQLDVLSALIDHVAFAIRMIALITLFSGLLVLASSLVATLDKRAYEITIFKVLGASSGDVMKSFLSEWLALAFITSLIAAGLGSAGAWLILQSMSWEDYEPLPSVLIETCLAAIFIMMVTGTFIHRRIFSRRSLEFLRNE